jgi:Protein of unknown function (DUF732)
MSEPGPPSSTWTEPPIAVQTPTTTVVLSPTQKFLADIAAQGWSPPTPEGAIAIGNTVCAMLAGPPRRTPAEVEAMALADNPEMSFAQAQTMVLIARNDLCPFS